MLKRIMALLVVLALFVGVAVFPASAASGDPVDYNDYVVDYTVDGENDTVTVVFPSSLSFWKEKELGPYGYGQSDFTVNYSAEHLVGGALFYYYIHDGLDLTNIPNGSLFHFYFSWDNSLIEPIVRIKVFYYDVNSNNIGNQVLFYQNLVYTDGITGLDIDVSKAMEKPDGAITASIQVELLDHMATEPITFHFDPLKIEMSIPSMVRLQEQTGKTNDLLQDMVDQEKITQEKMDEMISQEQANGEKLDDLQDTIEKQPEQEKQEAADTGDSGVNDMLEAIPDYSNMLDCFDVIVDSMSYTGTDCSLTTPTIKIPALAGITDEIVLLPPQEVDFEYWFNKVPIAVITLIRALFDVALVLYALKELYALLEYVLTLRRASSKAEE